MGRVIWWKGAANTKSRSASYALAARAGAIEESNNDNYVPEISLKDGPLYKAARRCGLKLLLPAS